MTDKYIVTRRPIANQFIDYTSVSAQSSVFTSETYILRLCSTTPIHYHIFAGSGTTSTCDSTDPLLGAGVVELVGTQPGARVSIIKAAGPPTSGDGRCTITEMG